MSKPEEVDYVGAVGEFLSGLLRRLGLEGGIEIKEEDDAMSVIIEGDGGAALRGDAELLGAVGGLVRQVLSRAVDSNMRCNIDVGAASGEEAPNIELMAALAGNFAEIAVRTGRFVLIESLGPSERRAVHTALVDDSRVTTRSADDNGARVLIVAPAGRD